MLRYPLAKWAITRSIPSLEGDEVHIWRVHLHETSRLLSDMERALSREEQARAARFHSEEARTSFVAGRGVLRCLLGSHIGLAPEAVPISLSVHGKPECVSPRCKISFSLSRSDGLILLALGRGRAIGVDVEYIDRTIPALQLARRFFAVKEAEAIASQKGDEQCRLFLEIWVRKEACLKALGLGLSIPLDTFTAPLACDPPVFQESRVGGHRGRMLFYKFLPWFGYVSALATDPPVPRIRFFDWPPAHQRDRQECAPF
jgi:4'-phosphopantetheinyl transferase